MPVPVSYPGVYVQEIPSGVVSISGVATSIALFMGMAQRGPMRTPRLLQNFTSFSNLFGTDPASGEMSDQVRQFFLNGGAQAYVMRLADGELAARVIVENEYGVPVLQFEAKDAGAIGETIRIEIDYATARPETTFNLVVYREAAGAGGQIQPVETETHKDLSMDSLSGRWVVDVLERDSVLIRASFVGAAVATVQGYALSGALGNAGTVAAARTDLFARITTAVNNAILRAGPGATAGRFEISVDEQSFVPVALTSPVATAADVETRINASLAPLGVSVTVNDLDLGAAGDRSLALRILSDNTGERSSVRIRRAPGVDDIAAELQLGIDDGGLEVGATAGRRPMANGIVARLGSAPNLVAALAELLRAARSAVTGVLMTDSSGPITAAFALPGNPAFSLFADPVSNVRSLVAGRDSLDLLVLALNTAFAGAPPPRRWTALRNGYRVVLRPDLPVPDFGPATTIGTDGGGTYDFAAAGSYLEAATQANVKAYRPGGYGGGISPFANGSQIGSPGTRPTAAQYDAAYEIVRRDVDIFNLLILPRAAGQVDADRNLLWGAASAFAKSRRAVLIMDPREAWRDVNQAKAELPQARTGVVKDHTAIYWPRLSIADPVTGARRAIDPSGSVAGICSRIDASRGVWKAPAGLEASIISIQGVEWRMSDEENGVINPEALNALRTFPNGIVVWGARTMDGFDNSGNTDYRYFPVRRTALFIEESLYRGLKFAVFQPNDEPLWAQIRLAAGAFMNGLFRQGAFQGSKTSDAYFVKCDAETTTQTDINLGIVNVLVAFAPLKPAEFIVLTIQQKAGQVQT
jgi:phage tail sheath protein FI